MPTINLTEMLKKHEGYRSDVYTDSQGHNTIGYGHKISSPEELEKYKKGTSQEEADQLLSQDISLASDSANRVFKNFGEYPAEKQEAFVNMTFNLGEAGVSKFKNMHAELQKGSDTDWDLVGEHMRDSKWSGQVGDRSTELIDIIKKKEVEEDSFEAMVADYAEEDSFERMAAENWSPPTPEEEALEEDFLLTAVTAITASAGILMGTSAAVVTGATTLLGEAGSAYLGKAAGEVNPDWEFPVYFASQLLSAFTVENWLFKKSIQKLAEASPKFWSKEFEIAKSNGWLSKEFVDDTADIVKNMDMGNAEASGKLLNMYKQQAYDLRIEKVGKQLDKLGKVLPPKSENIDEVISALQKKKTLVPEDYQRLARIAKEDTIQKYSTEFNKFKANTVNKLANEKWHKQPTKELVEALKKQGGIPSDYKFASKEIADTFLKKHPDLVSKSVEGAKLDKLALEFSYSSTDDMIVDVFSTYSKTQLRRIATAELKTDFDRIFTNEVSVRIAATESDYLFKLHGRTKGFKEGRISKQKHVEALRRAEGALPAKLVMREVQAGKRATAKLLSIVQKTAQKDIGRLKKVYAQKLSAYQAAVSVEKKLRVINRRVQNSFGVKGEYGAQLDSLLAPLYNKQAVRPAEHMWGFLTRKYNDEVSIGADILVKQYNELLRVLPFKGRTFLDLTYDQAKDLDDFVRTFKFVASNEKYINYKGSKQLIEHWAQGVKKSAMTTIPKIKALQPRITGTQLEEISEGTPRAIANAMRSTADLANGALASLKRIEPICVQLDGFKEFGPAWRNIFNRTAMAEVSKEVLGAKIFKKYDEIFATHRATVATKPKKYWTATSGNLEGLPINKETAVLMALNAQHSNNMEAMLAGLGISKAVMQKFLKTAINEADKKLIDGVLDTLDEMYPLLAKIHLRKTGTVLPRPKGGRYFPILRDSRFGNISGSIDDVFLDTGSDLFYTEVKKTFMNIRKGGVKAVQLDFKGLTQHLADVVHYTTHWEALNDIQKLTRNPTFKEAVENSMGKEIYNQFDPWLKNLARPTRTKIDTTMGKMRRNVTFASLAFVPKIAVKQTLSFITAMPEIGYGNAVKAVYEFSTNPSKFIAAVNRSSPEMANRSKTWNRDLIELMAETTTAGSKARLMQWGYAMIHKVDSVTASITWKAGYEKGLQLFDGNANKAVNYANKAVRKTQPASAAKDIPLIMRSGEGLRAVSMFYSYWSVFHNQVGEIVAKGLSGHMSKTEVMGTLAWLTIAPAVTQQLAGAAWNTLTGREQKAEHMKEVAQGMALNMVGGLPVLRDITTSVVKGYDYQVSPLITIPKTAVEVLSMPFKDELGSYDAESVAKLLSYITIFPSKASITLVEGALRNYEGESNDLFELIDKPPYKK